MSKVYRAQQVTRIAMSVALFGIAHSAGAQELPSAPTDEELDAAIQTHHPDLLDRPLGEGLEVWFVLDSDGDVAATGIDRAEGLEEKLRAEHPRVSPGYHFRIDYVTINGRFVPVLWLIPAFL